MDPISFYQYDRTTDSRKLNIPNELPKRPAFNSLGKAVSIRVNQFKITQFSDKPVYQYDVHIGNGAEKRGLIKAVWESSELQAKLKQIDSLWLFDGNKIAWCLNKPPRKELRIRIDLDKERGRAPRKLPDGTLVDTTIGVRITQTATIGMSVVRGYLDGAIAFDSSVLEAITFMDHCMRQWPSELYTVVKRSFFARGNGRTPLDNVIEAMKGVYSSIRLCPTIASVGTSTGLALNVDVANGTFWASQSLAQAARNFCKDRNRGLSYIKFRDLLMPTKDSNVQGGLTMSRDFKELRKMSKLKFNIKHRGKEGESKTYTIKGFLFDVKYGVQGAHAKAVTFDQRLPNGQVKTTSVYEYFIQKYNIHLEHWYLPLVKTEKDGLFPMEVCNIIPNQRYSFKLTPDQTSNMIRFAVTRPRERLHAIQHGVQMLKWNQDQYLAHYGIKVDTALTITHARILQNPEVQFGGTGKVNPGTTGRWDLRGKKFLESNPVPLKCWGIAIIGQCVAPSTVQNFLKTFIQAYVGHGGNVVNKTPFIYNPSRDADLAETVTALRIGAGNQHRMEPQILLYVLPGRDSFLYERLKKNNECRYGLVSQCLNSSHVLKAQPQYCSNVCMKLNAKLGGTTCRVSENPKLSPKFFQAPTMVVGVDVSHASPGSQQASMAAITISMDRAACRYAAAVQTNGKRVEMISSLNIRRMFIPMFNRWCKKFNTVPAHIYYFRDGVSEGQYNHVLEQEIADVKMALKEAYPDHRCDNIKFTVTVASKRHHIRFFPMDGDNSAADKNGNSLPGTLVERDVTHPFEYDFYLSSHSAIQGTARPTHYYVICDEAIVPVDKFQSMVYQHCYQYMRSTTPVSLYPAIYYAHLASNRARAHEDVPASSGPQSGQKFIEKLQDDNVKAAHLGIAQSTTSGSSNKSTEAAPLVRLGIGANDEIKESIATSMWYI